MLRIRDWSDLYENHRTRELKKLDFVLLPNRLDSDGYTELIDHDNGPLHFATWVVMLQIASRCDVRGTLVRSGGRPHDAKSIARITRIPEPIIAEAIHRLVHEVRWVEEVADIPREVAPIPRNVAEISQRKRDDNRTEGKEGKEGKEHGATPDEVKPLTTEGKTFDLESCAERMYLIHPKKKDRFAVPQAIFRLIQRYGVDRMPEVETLHAQMCRSEDWAKDRGKYCPKLHEWLDDLALEPPKPKSAQWIPPWKMPGFEPDELSDPI